jgi:hypothetical protein
MLARPLATMVAETASIVVDGCPKHCNRQITLYKILLCLSFSFSGPKHGLWLWLSLMTKSTMSNECALSTGRFDGHGGAPEQYRRHRLMRHVQGYSGSHWTPPLGNYLLRIAPAAARATCKQTTIINKYT